MWGHRVGMMQTVVLTGILLTGGLAHAGRPLAIDDADPAFPAQVEIEAGVAYEYDRECTHWDVPFGVTVGMIPGVEAGMGFGGQFEERNELLEDGTEECVREDGVGDLVIAAKWQFFASCPLGARHALSPSVKLPTADDDEELGSGEVDGDLTWIVSRSMGEKVGAHLNVGYSWIGGPADDILHCGVAVDYQVSKALQWVGEVFAVRELVSGTDTVGQWNTGFRWSPTESVTLDLSGGSRMSSGAPDFAGTLGVTWVLGVVKEVGD